MLGFKWPSLPAPQPPLVMFTNPGCCGHVAECLTTLQEYDNNGATAEGSWRLQLMQRPTSHRFVELPLGRMEWI
jgi:hypothetical protein